MDDIWANIWQWINDFLNAYMDSPLPEETVISFAKSIKFCFDELAPVAVAYIVFIYNYINKEG